jgi:hypothetical protein
MIFENRGRKQKKYAAAKRDWKCFADKKRIHRECNSLWVVSRHRVDNCVTHSTAKVIRWRHGWQRYPEKRKTEYTDDGQLIPFKAEVYREWIFVGTPVTPDDLNDGEASFPEFHNVYINPYAWQAWKKTGTFPNGTIMVKELTSVGTKHAPSGNGYFEGEFTGLEMAVKDATRYPAESKGWGYYSFGHKYPLKAHAELNRTESCAACHVQSAGDDMVFTQYYPVLRAAKGK